MSNTNLFNSDARLHKEIRNFLNGKECDSELANALANKSYIADRFAYMYNRVFLETWLKLPEHPEIVTKKSTPLELRSMTLKFFDNYLKGLKYLPANLKIETFIEFCELSHDQEVINASIPFLSDIQNFGDPLPFCHMMHRMRHGLIDDIKEALVSRFNSKCVLLEGMDFVDMLSVLLNQYCAKVQNLAASRGLSVRALKDELYFNKLNTVTPLNTLMC